MVQHSFAARCLGWVLILQCAHVPIPCSDGAERAAGKQGVDEERVDIDFVLLGADLPDDVDDGPLDDDPEKCPTPFGDFFLVVKAEPKDGGSKLAHSLADRVFRILVDRTPRRVSRISMCTLEAPQSFGASFAISTPQAWRELLSVFLI